MTAFAELRLQCVSLIKDGEMQVCMCRRGGGACDLALCFRSSFSACYSSARDGDDAAAP